MKSFFIYLIKFYQKYISVFTKSNCRYYPTCSEYALMQFKFNNIFLALFYSLKRVLKCNQLFKGGFDYVKIDKKNLNCSYKKIKVKYWLIPKNNKLIIIKNNYF